MVAISRLAHDWYQADLPANVELGERAWLHSTYAFLHYASTRPVGVRVGADSGVYVGSHFDLGPNGEVDIGRATTVAGVIFSSDRRITIGDFCFISYAVVLADDHWAMPGADEESAPGEPDPAVVIEDDAWIGAHAVLLAGARVGRGAIVGAGTVLAEPVPPYAVVAGAPPVIVGSSPPGLAAPDAPSTAQP